MITLADEETTKLYAWCTGQSASAILQISPDEFCDLPEVKQNNLFLYVLVIKVVLLMAVKINEKGKINFAG